VVVGLSHRWLVLEQYDDHTEQTKHCAERDRFVLIE
jgi:hypothetical protein